MLNISHKDETIGLVVLEMTSAVAGIFSNLLIVSSVRGVERLQRSTINLLLANICFSNLLISALVKPISAIYVSYSHYTGQGSVGLAFCSLYTLTFRHEYILDH